MGEMIVAALSTLRQGMTPVTCGAAKLLLVREGDAVHALEGLCPHAGAPLHEGALCDGRIICPWHMGTFDARTGALLEPVAMRSLAVHAVRISGDDILVDPEPVAQPSPAMPPDDRVFVLAGAGAAAAMAAVTLRDGGFAGRLVMVSPDPADPLDRTQLSKMALSAADFDRATLPLFDDATWQSLAIERLAGSVAAIDPPARRLTLADGQVLDYHAVLLATGATPVPLTVPGADQPLVRMLRTLADVDGIAARVREGGQAVIVGTSFIGMEAASALAERGMAVTVIGEDAVPFARQFGERVGAAIRTLHEAHGVTFRLGAELARITEAAAVLASGETLAADLVVVGVGVRPAVDYAGTLPQAKDGGLVADHALRVADGVWAAGDIAAPDGWPRIEHWRLAQQHGRIAALAMLGRPATYEGVPFFWTAQHGKRLHYVGHAETWDEIAYDGEVEAFDFTAWYLKDDRVAAALICGRDRAAALLSQALHARLSLGEARRLVA